MQTQRGASEIQFLRKHSHIAIESKLDAGIHSTSPFVLRGAPT